MSRLVKKFRVSIRRGIGLEVKPESEQVDGKTFTFIRGWEIEDDELYPGETAWCARDENYPLDAPAWIASGDLQEITT